MPCYGVGGKAFEYHELFPEHSRSYQIRKLVTEALLQGYEAGMKSQVERIKENQK